MAGRSRRLLLGPCRQAPVMALCNRDVFGEGDAEDEEDLSDLICTGDIGEWLSLALLGEKTATSFKLLSLPSLELSCGVSSEKERHLNLIMVFAQGMGRGGGGGLKSNKTLKSNGDLRKQRGQSF